MSGQGWPVAELDAVARMRVLVAGLPHAAYEERVLDAPFDAVWALAGDLERGVPRFEGGVDAIEILTREGERLSLVSVGFLGSRMRFEAVLRPGWCVMRSRFAQIGMAAAPASDGRTRFAHFEDSTIGRALARPILRRSVRRDLDRLEALLREPQPGEGSR